MSEYGKVTGTHLRRAALVYVRQSSASQLERNRESTDRQYGLVERAVVLGWPRPAVRVIDADLGVSGSRDTVRSGFTELTSLVGLGQVGIVLALEVSRLARSNTDWYRLLDLTGLTDTLLADTDGVYHPALFNDRLTLGLKGTMAEAELHVLRARLDGGIRNKAERGELRRGLPVGLVWGEEPGEIRKHLDEAVTGVIDAIFTRFAGCGSVRATWLWLRGQRLSFPLQRSGRPELDWVTPTYTAVHHVLTNPAYAGAYAYGKTRQERRVDETGTVHQRRRRLAAGEWEVLIPDHHDGFIDWATWQANQVRIGANENDKLIWPHCAGLIWPYPGLGVGGSFLVSCAGESVAAGAGLDDVGVEGEPVDNGSGQSRVGEGVAPFGEGGVGGAGDGGAFFSGGDDLKQQLGAARVQGQVADLVQTEQIEPGVAAEDAGELFVIGRFGELVDQLRAGQVADPTALFGGDGA